MARTAWGIDIGDAAIKAVKLGQVGRQIRLLDLRVLRYSVLRSDARGRDDEVIRQAVATLKKDAIGRNRCIVSVPSQNVFSRFISLPPVDKRRIPEIATYEARQQIPFDLAEVVWAYHVIGDPPVPGEEIGVALLAIKREVIAFFLEVLEAIRRQIDGLQVGPIGLYNFLCHGATPSTGLVVLDVGAGASNLVIVDGNKFWMRNLPIAGRSFTAALQKRFSISEDEAENLKCHVEKSRHRRRILEVLKPVLKDLAGEIMRSVGYYKALSRSVKFDEMLLYGLGSRLHGLRDFLSQELPYPVRAASDVHGIECDGLGDLTSQFRADLPGLGVALGMAIQGLGHAVVDMDLSPPELARRRGWVRRNPFAVTTRLARKAFGSLKS